MSLEIQIRRATESDEPGIYKLICQLVGHNVNQTYFQKVYRQNLQTEGIFYWVLTNKNEVVAFASMHIQYLLHHEGKVAELQELCVDEKYRSMSFGKFLQEEAVQEAQKQGCELIELAASRKREDAHRFYEREGWERTHYKFTKKL